MLLLQDGVLAFLSAVGLTTIVWAAAGVLLHLGGRPAIPGLLLVLPLRGDPRRGTRRRNLSPRETRIREDVSNGRAHLPGGHHT